MYTVSGVKYLCVFLALIAMSCHQSKPDINGKILSVDVNLKGFDSTMSFHSDSEEYEDLCLSIKRKYNTRVNKLDFFKDTGDLFISDSIIKYSTLNSIKIVADSIVYMSPEIFKLPELFELMIVGKIQQWPEGIINSSQLKILSYNIVNSDTLPVEIYSLRNLKSLNIGCNVRFIDIDKISKMPSMRRLNLTCSKFLEDEFRKSPEMNQVFKLIKKAPRIDVITTVGM